MKTVLSSRKFWVTAIALVAILIGVIYPQIGTNLDTRAEGLGGAIALLAAYVIGLALDPGGGWCGILQSRKFWAMTVGITVMLLDIFGIVLPYGLTEPQVVAICVSLGAYILGVAVEGKYDLITALIENVTASAVVSKRK